MKWNNVYFIYLFYLLFIFLFFLGVNWWKLFKNIKSVEILVVFCLDCCNMVFMFLFFLVLFLIFFVPLWKKISLYASSHSHVFHQNIFEDITRWNIASAIFFCCCQGRCRYKLWHCYHIINILWFKSAFSYSLHFCLLNLQHTEEKLLILQVHKVRRVWFEIKFAFISKI